MNPEQSELLIRVDQNVLNLVDTVKAHIEKDEAFQKFIWNEIDPIKTANAERRGATRFAGVLYGAVGSVLTLLANFFYHYPRS